MGVIMLAGLDDVDVRDGDGNAPETGEELCGVVSAFVTAAVDAEAEAERVLVWSDCSALDGQIVH